MSYLVKNILAKDIATAATRSGFGEGLVEAAKKNKNIVGLCGDLTESTKMDAFAKAYPERFIECGVAEQNMAGVAAGLALTGKIPFMASYAAFSPGRNWGQIRVSVCYQNANVKIVGSHAGLSVGPDGATHQALEDIALTRVLPNMTVVVPCDKEQAKYATLALAAHKGPAYLRLTRSDTPVFTTLKTPFILGKIDTYRKGRDITLIAAGPILYEALYAAELLSQRYKIEARVLNCHTIKPLDAATLTRAARETGAIVIVEEHQIAGGLGSAVAEAVSESTPVPIKRVGVKDSFGESGKSEELMKKYKLTRGEIVQQALKAINMKHKTHNS